MWGPPLGGYPRFVPPCTGCTYGFGPLGEYLELLGYSHNIGPHIFPLSCSLVRGRSQIYIPCFHISKFSVNSLGRWSLTGHFCHPQNSNAGKHGMHLWNNINHIIFLITNWLPIKDPIFHVKLIKQININLPPVASLMEILRIYYLVSSTFELQSTYTRTGSVCITISQNQCTSIISRIFQNLPYKLSRICDA